MISFIKHVQCVPLSHIYIGFPPQREADTFPHTVWVDRPATTWSSHWRSAQSSVVQTILTSFFLSENGSCALSDERAEVDHSVCCSFRAESELLTLMVDLGTFWIFYSYWNRALWLLYNYMRQSFLIIYKVYFQKPRNISPLHIR